MKNFSSYRAHKVKLLTWNAKNRNKSAILNFFSAIFELVREMVISIMHNTFGKDIWDTFHVISPKVNVNADADDAELQLQ